MKWKSLLIVIVLNIFAMLGSSILYEYINLSERFQNLQNTVNMSLDLAIDSSVTSEELFTSKYQGQMVSSYGTGKQSGNASLVSSSILLFRNGAWYQGNSYIMAMYYNNNNRFPNSASEYSSMENQVKEIADIYEYLYGDVGEGYSDTALSWANKNTSTVNKYKGISGISHPTSSTSRKSNTASYNASPLASSVASKQMNDFTSYYNNIGQYITTTSIIKERRGMSTDYDIKRVTFPTLAQMGLKLHSYNYTNSSITADNFISSYHIGKATVGKSKTAYYLTPYSLGVTYIPISVLKPMFLANLETIVRLNKLSSSDLENFDEANDIVAQADGCVETGIYADDPNIPTQHKVVAGENIINDGMIEYDLSTAQVKVDYFVVDFYNTANKDIVGRIEGCMGGYSFNGTNLGVSTSTLLANTVHQLEATDTGNIYHSSMGNSNIVDGKRIVARVTCKIKVHVLYRSPIIQWAQWLSQDRSHYSIKLWDEANNTITNGDDGVWYQYTTYYSVTR